MAEEKQKTIEEENGPNTKMILSAAALFAGLCKMVPVPFLDKFLLSHVHRQMIASILAKNDIKCKAKDLYPLYKNYRGCFIRLLFFIFVFPFLLIIKLIINFLKWLFFFLVIREAALDMGKTILLGHTVERCILDGRIPTPDRDDKKSYKKTFKATVKCKKKLDKAFKGSDMRVISHLFLGTVKSLKKTPGLLKVTKKIFMKNIHKSNIKEDLQKMDSDDKSSFRMFTDEITLIMDNKETQAYMNSFDKKFDELWG